MQEIKAYFKSAFRINVSFGYTLYNDKEVEYKYFYPSNNNLLFETAYEISINQDLTNFYHKIVGLDLVTNYYLKKPSSQWIVAGLNNVTIFVYPLQGVLVGSPITLPEYILRSNAIHALVKDYANHHDLDDKKCFWRCLALHLKGKITSLEKLANKKECEEHTRNFLQNGVTLPDIPGIEVYFDVYL